MNGHAQTEMKVWRPRGFAEVEVERFENVEDLVIAPFVLPGHEISVVLKGGGRLEYKGEQYRLTSDNLLLTQHPGEVIFADCRGVDTSVWTLRLYPEQMHALQTDLGLGTDATYFPEMMAPAGLNDTLAALTKATIEAFSEPASRLEHESNLLNLVHAVLVHCADTPPSNRDLGKEHGAVVLIKEVLHAHSERDNTLSDLSNLTGLNKHYLYRVFCRDVGLSPHRYQTAVRVEKAKTLLAEGESVAQVALETGFVDQSHFTRAFKKGTQVTPGQFQRDSLKNSAAAAAYSGGHGW